MMEESESSELLLLRCFVGAEGQFLSGEYLAKQLGLSRVSVWHYMERLAEDGFVFEAVRGKGYRLQAEPEEVVASWLQAHWAAKPRPLSLLCYQELDSTNSEVERQLASGRNTPFVVVANRQTQGRGRLGRVWQSEQADNLYVSFGFTPQLPVERMQTFTLWMGVVICRFLREVCALPVQLKWPNDLLLGSKKVAGMLVEAKIDADAIRNLVMGLGLNINGSLADTGEDLAGKATTLAEYAGHSFSINALGAGLVQAVLRGYQEFIDEAFGDALLKAWSEVDALAGQWVRVEGLRDCFEGQVEGLAEDGSLLVLRQDTGQCEAVRAGDVSLSAFYEEGRVSS